MAEVLAKALGAMNKRLVHQNESTTYPSMSAKTKQLMTRARSWLAKRCRQYTRRSCNRCWAGQRVG